ncbi:MAG TPA: hypothetical protein DD618_05010 [Acholeplasmatales bacterium]|nr:hypothetical protein [Acholeplasmatales bacterium]
MKFPDKADALDDETVTPEKTEELSDIWKRREEILTECETAEPIDLRRLMEAGLAVKAFEETISAGRRLLSKNRETMGIIYYLILACLGKKDVFLAMSFIKKSRLLNRDEFREFHSRESSNYSTLWGRTDTDFDTMLALLMMIFTEGLAREITIGSGEEPDFLLVRYFDFLNSLCEIGYSHEIMNELQQAMAIIFDLND